jgi:histone H3/H4
MTNPSPNISTSQSQPGQSEPDDRVQVQEEEAIVADGEGEGDGQSVHHELNEGEGKDTEAAEREASGDVGEKVGDAAGAKTKRRERRERASLEREGRKLILPFSRVQRALKADRVRIYWKLTLEIDVNCLFSSCKDLPIIAKEAVFLISLATEEFIKSFTQATQRLAEKERRATVQPRDVGKPREIGVQRQP